MRRISIKPNVILCCIFGAVALLIGAMMSLIAVIIWTEKDTGYEVSETERTGTVVSIGVEESEEYGYTYEGWYFIEMAEYEYKLVANPKYMTDETTIQSLTAGDKIYFRFSETYEKMFQIAIYRKAPVAAIRSDSQDIILAEDYTNISRASDWASSWEGFGGACIVPCAFAIVAIVNGIVIIVKKKRQKAAQSICKTPMCETEAPSVESPPQEENKVEERVVEPALDIKDEEGDAFFENRPKRYETTFAFTAADTNSRAWALTICQLKIAFILWGIAFILSVMLAVAGGISGNSVWLTRGIAIAGLSLIVSISAWVTWSRNKKVVGVSFVRYPSVENQEYTLVREGDTFKRTELFTGNVFEFNKKEITRVQITKKCIVVVIRSVLVVDFPNTPEIVKMLMGDE